MKIGLIARCEVARGIAIQSRNFFDHMPVDRVLLVRMPRPDCAERPDWYPGRTDAVYNARVHELDEDLVRSWLGGLDVVFTVETPNDWRIPIWCREAGVKLVIQGNPEFVRHGQPAFDHYPHPDQWWWPTSWRKAKIPEGRVMPVPMDPRPASSERGDRLRVLHVIGKRAFADRNGTELVAQAVRMITEPTTLTIHSIDGDLPCEFPRAKHVTYDVRVDAVDDQWSMYDDQDLLLLPRRYGGLCLPALEAAAAGMVVAMPNCSPNEELATVFYGGMFRRQVNLACGPTPIFDADPAQMAEAVSAFARDDVVATATREMQAALLPTWDVWRDRYLQAFEELL
jgi:hypothetical protein